VRNPFFLEDTPASLLRSQPEEFGIGAEDRQLELDGELGLVLRHAEGQDEGHLGVADEAADPADRPRPGQKLPRERLIAAVDERDREEPVARLRCVQLGNEPEVVVEHARVNRLRGDVYDP